MKALKFRFIYIFLLASANLLFAQFTVVAYEEQALESVHFVIGEPGAEAVQEIRSKDPAKLPKPIALTLVAKENKSYQSFVELSHYGIEKKPQDTPKKANNPKELVIGGPSSDLFTYQDIENDIYFSKESMGFQKVWVYDKIPKIDWKIEKEKQKIGKYLCRKATAEYQGEKITAWFTEKIPIPMGPKYFGGLPGLILSVETDEDRWSVSKIIRNANIDFEFPKPEKKPGTMDLASYSKKSQESYKQFIKGLRTSNGKDIIINMDQN